MHSLENRNVGTIRDQLRRNAVALISVAVALSSLAYNTWRNERTEGNRNVRAAAFEILTRLAELERITFLAQYDRDVAGGNPRTGWTYALSIRDLSELMPPPVHAQAAVLLKVWGRDWDGLGQDDEVAVNEIDDAIGKLRMAALSALRALR